MKFTFFLLVPILALTACGTEPQTARLVGRVRAPIDFHMVRLYLPQCAPAQYKTVAKLDTSKLGLNSSYQFNLRWIKQLRKQAAALGANGLLLIPIAPAATSGYVRHGPSFNARAIWEPPVSAPTAGTVAASAAAERGGQGPFFHGVPIWEQQILRSAQAVGKPPWAASCAEATKPFLYEVLDSAWPVRQ